MDDRVPFLLKRPKVYIKKNKCPGFFVKLLKKKQKLACWLFLTRFFPKKIRYQPIVSFQDYIPLFDDTFNFFFFVLECNAAQWLLLWIFFQMASKNISPTYKLGSKRIEKTNWNMYSLWLYLCKIFDCILPFQKKSKKQNWTILPYAHVPLNNLFKKNWRNKLKHYLHMHILTSFDCTFPFQKIEEIRLERFRKKIEEIKLKHYFQKNRRNKTGTLKVHAHTHFFKMKNINLTIVMFIHSGPSKITTWESSTL